MWRLWLPEGRSDKSDIYVAPRVAARITKVSLHESGDCRAGFTREHEIERGWDQLEESGHRQIFWWERPTGPGTWSRPLTIRIPYRSIRTQADFGQRDRTVGWIEAPAIGSWVDFDVVFRSADADWPPFVGARATLAEFALPNDECVRVVYGYKVMTTRDRREIADSVAATSSVDDEQAGASTLLLPPEHGRLVWIDLPV